jgi:hypothetical protein
LREIHARSKRLFRKKSKAHLSASIVPKQACWVILAQIMALEVGNKLFLPSFAFISLHLPRVGLDQPFLALSLVWVILAQNMVLEVGNKLFLPFFTIIWLHSAPFGTIRLKRPHRRTIELLRHA